MVSNDAEGCRDLFGDVGVRDLLRSLGGDFTLTLDEHAVAIVWSAEMDPNSVWSASPLVVALSQWRPPGRAHAYR